MRTPFTSRAVLLMLPTLALAACASGKQPDTSSKSASSSDAKGSKVKDVLGLHGFDLEQGKVDAEQSPSKSTSRFNIQVLDGDDPVVGVKVSIVRLEPGAGKGKLLNKDMTSATGASTNLFTLFVDAGRDYMIYAEAPHRAKVSRHIVIDTKNPVDVDFPLQFNRGDEVIGQNGQKGLPPQQGQSPGWETSGDGEGGATAGAGGEEFTAKGLKYCDISGGDFAQDMKQLFDILATDIPEATPAIKDQLAGGGKPIACSGAEWPSISVVFKMPLGKTVRIIIDDASRLGPKYYDNGDGVIAGSGGMIPQQQQKPTKQAQTQTPPAKTPAAGDDDTPVAAAPAGDDDDSSACQPAGGAAAKGALLGTISDATTDLPDFKGKTVYAMKSVTSNFHSLMFAITTVEARDSMFRKIKSWECKKKSTCDQGTTAQSLTVLFMPSFTNDPNHKVDATAFPKGDANHKDGQADMTAGMMISYSGNAAATDNKGDFNFTAGKRPAKVGDEFEVTADLRFQDGKAYKAKLKGKVYEMPTPPTPPTCKDDEQANPVYE